MNIKPPNEPTLQGTLFNLDEPTGFKHKNKGERIFKSTIERAYLETIDPKTRKRDYKKLVGFISWLTPLTEKNMIFESLIQEPISVQLQALKKAYECLARTHLLLSLNEENGSPKGNYHAQKSRYYNSIFGTLIRISNNGFEEQSPGSGHPVALVLWNARKVALRENPPLDLQPTLFS